MSTASAVRSSGDIQVFSPEEVWSLVRAGASETDSAIFLTAAFTGLRRGELLGLRWRDVDFAGSTILVRASYAAGYLTAPKSGKVRSVPMAPDVDRKGTFGTRMIAKAEIRRVQEWMGHADIQTTTKYLRYAPRREDAELVALAFGSESGSASREAPD